MGQRLRALAEQDDELTVAGLWESPGHPSVGRDGIVGAIEPAIANARVYIDFTRPEPTLKHLDAAAAQGVAAVVGTTGFERPVPELFADVAQRIPIVWAPNMSIGITLLRKLVYDAVRALGSGYDAEIIEMHHRWKEDAPSGTAKALLRSVQQARGNQGRVVTGREGMTGERRDDDIGVLALRGGDVVGDHTVILAGTGERIELGHRAGSRDTFAAGALRAARWVVDQPPGLYDMFDVLGWSDARID